MTDKLSNSLLYLDGVSVSFDGFKALNSLSFVVEPVDIVRTKERMGVDKVSRAHAVVPLFASGLVFAPDRSWADMVITQCSMFPRAKHDDLVDSTTMALGWLRRNGMLIRGEEWTADVEKSMEYTGAAPPPLYFA